MKKINNAFLSDRSLLKVKGKDALSFLQRIITNDIEILHKKRIIFSALLTPQGKFVADFFVYYFNDNIILDINKHFKKDFLNLMKLYRLRNDIVFSDFNDYKVMSVWGDDEKLALNHIKNNFKDPRNCKLGYRVFVSNDNSNNIKLPEPQNINNYNLLLIKNTVADGFHDLEVNKSFILEYNYNEYSAVSFDKGCFVGQELTTRTFRRGVIRKSVFSFHFDSKIHPAKIHKGDEIFLKGQKIGKVTSIISSDNHCYFLSLLKKEGYELIDEEIAINDHKILIKKL